MSVIHRAIAISLGIVALPLLPLPAHAETAADAPQPAWTSSANVGVFSQYVFRGLTQTNEKPALQGGFDLGHESGWYGGVWLSNISWISDATPTASASLEADIYTGIKRPFNDLLAWDIGVLHYAYPGSYPNGFTNPDTTEIYAGLDGKWITARYSYSLTNTFGSADTRGSGYLDITLTHEIAGGVNGVAHIGRQRYTGPNASNLSYTDWKLGLNKDFSGYVLGVYYTGTNASDAAYTVKDKNLGRDRIVLSASRSF